MARANYERAKTLYPSWEIDESSLVSFFNTSEGFSAFGRLIGDIYQRAKIEEERALGIKRLGRKPRVAVSIDEVLATVFPQQWSTEPFPGAFTELLNGRSQRQFAMKCGINQSTLSRFLTGASKPDRYTLERIADAARVPPWYFTEWRAMFVAEFFRQMLSEHPALGITTIKQLRSLT